MATTPLTQFSFPAAPKINMGGGGQGHRNAAQISMQHTAGQPRKHTLALGIVDLSLMHDKLA